MVHRWRPELPDSLSGRWIDRRGLRRVLYPLSLGPPSSGLGLPPARTRV